MALERARAEREAAEREAEAKRAIAEMAEQEAAKKARAEQDMIDKAQREREAATRAEQEALGCCVERHWMELHEWLVTTEPTGDFNYVLRVNYSPQMGRGPELRTARRG